MFLAEAQPLLERIGVRFVHLEAGILFADPRLVVPETRLPLPGGHLFDADGDFHNQRWLGGWVARLLGTTDLATELPSYRATQLPLIAFEQQRRVGAAEAERIRQGVVHRHRA